MSSVIVIHGGRARVFDGDSEGKLLEFIGGVFSRLYKLGQYIYLAASLLKGANQQCA